MNYPDNAGEEIQAILWTTKIMITDIPAIPKSILIPVRTIMKL